MLDAVCVLVVHTDIQTPKMVGWLKMLLLFVNYSLGALLVQLWLTAMRDILGWYTPI